MAYYNLYSVALSELPGQEAAAVVAQALLEPMGYTSALKGRRSALAAATIAAATAA
jgi:hypothetical protein